MAENLYCPRCGKQFTSETSFCRTCGLSLDGVSAIVNGEAADAPEMTSRPNSKLMRMGTGLFIFGTVIGLATAAVRDFDLFPQAYGKLVFMTIVAAGLLLIATGFLFPIKQYQKPKSLPGSKPKLDTAPLNDQLNPASVDDISFPVDTRELEHVAVGSVTENTTRSLSNSN